LFIIGSDSLPNEQKKKNKKKNLLINNNVKNKK